MCFQIKREKLISGKYRCALSGVGGTSRQDLFRSKTTHFGAIHFKWTQAISISGHDIINIPTHIQKKIVLCFQSACIQKSEVKSELGTWSIGSAGKGPQFPATTVSTGLRRLVRIQEIPNEKITSRIPEQSQQSKHSVAYIPHIKDEK